ncbi:hypothetical protein KIH77_04955 [Bifidobacterium sp. 82T24]|uniref:transglutaminase domain-containing protein n=1 Tax=Bifidobacterium pluvialisilvae TaxID=2834436 RepID=UPI001C572BAE|nr:transglutaminase domain-containing protein [Bifidobacterium pluvialisilvae]MBW3088084.1 hypothetical protein [Bifidobacterium pluvialisilvae]
MPQRPTQPGQGAPQYNGPRRNGPSGPAQYGRPVPPYQTGLPQQPYPGTPQRPPYPSVGDSGNGGGRRSRTRRPGSRATRAYAASSPQPAAAKAKSRRTNIITLVVAAVVIIAMYATYTFFTNRNEHGYASGDMSVYGNSFDTSKYDLQKPWLDTPSDVVFSENIGKMSTMMKLDTEGVTQDGEPIAAVYTDPALTQRYSINVTQDKEKPGYVNINAASFAPCANYYDPGKKILHAQSFTDIIKNDYYVGDSCLDRQLDDDYFAGDGSVGGKFIGFERYFLVLYYGEDGEKLAKPKVTYFTVYDDKHDLDTPQNVRVDVDKKGNVNVSWNPVEGATHYNVYLRTGGKIKSKDASDQEKKRNDTSSQSTYLLAKPTKNSVNLADWDPTKAPGFAAYLSGAFHNVEEEAKKGQVYSDTPIYQNMQFANLFSGESEDQGFTPGSSSLEKHHAEYQRTLSNTSLLVVAFGDDEKASNSQVAQINITSMLSQVPLGPAFNAMMDDSNVNKEYITYLTVADGLTRIVPRRYDWSTAKVTAEGVEVKFHLGQTRMQSTQVLTDKGSTVEEVKARVEKDTETVQASDKQTGLMGGDGSGTIDWNDDTGDISKAVDMSGVNGSIEYVKFIAANLMQDRTYMDVTKYYDQASAPTAQDAVDEAVAQNPLILHTYAYSATKRSGDKVYLKVQYYDDSYGSDTANVRKDLSAKADQIVSKIITPGMDARAKATAINQYLVDNFEYDYATYRNEMQTNTTGGKSFYVRHKSNQNASGLLGNYAGQNLSVTVCAGYAKAYKLLADKAKLDTVYVTGTVNTGTTNGGHAWNKVKVDGQWLVVDSTWNDSDGGATTRYLLVSDSSDVIRARGQVYDHDEIVDAKLADYGIS